MFRLSIIKRSVDQTCTLCKYTSNISGDATVRDKQSEINSARPFHQLPGPGGIYKLPLIGGLFLLKPFSPRHKKFWPICVKRRRMVDVLKEGIGRCPLGTFRLVDVLGRCPGIKVDLKAKYTNENIHELLDNLGNQYGSLYRLNLGYRTVVTSNPQHILTVFRKEGIYPRRITPRNYKFYYEDTQKVQPLSVLDGQDWKDRRKPLQKIMGRPKSAICYLESQAQCTRDLVDCLEKTSPKEVRDMLFAYTTETIGVVCFNKRMGLLHRNLSEEGRKYLKNSREFFRLLTAQSMLPPSKLYKPAVYKQFKIVADHMTSFTDGLIKEAFEEITKMQHERTMDLSKSSLMSYLIIEEKMSVKEIESTISDVLFAGTDSTAKTLENIIDLLARNPAVQERLFKEIQQYLGQDEDITDDILPKLTYLAACVKEGMRVRFPTTVGSARIIDKDIVLGGYHIPKDALVLLNFRGLGLNSNYAFDINTFKPERWLREKNGVKGNDLPSMCSQPFSMGIRNCLGRRFAEQVIYIAVSKIIQRYKVSLLEPIEDPTIIYHTFGVLKHQPMFIFTKRHH